MKKEKTTGEVVVQKLIYIFQVILILTFLGWFLGFATGLGAILILMVLMGLCLINGIEKKNAHLWLLGTYALIVTIGHLMK